MKKIIDEYASFNTWANDRIGNIMVSLSDAQLNLAITSSFSSIRATVLHLWDAQEIWLSRLNGISPAGWPSAVFKGNKEALHEGWMKSSLALEKKANSFEEEGLHRVVNYTSIKGLAGKDAVYRILMQVFNHGTYHRGQLVTMFRQAGVTQIPSTDLIAFYRQQQP